MAGSLDRWIAISNDYHARLAVILDATETASEHEGDCEVCAVILEIKPRDVPDFLAALEHVGPILGQESITVGGVWTFSREAYLWHESQHGT